MELNPVTHIARRTFCRATAGLWLTWGAWAPAGRVAAADAPTIRRVLPPEGKPLAAADEDRLRQRLAALTRAVEAARAAWREPQRRALLVDVEVFAKAVEYALDLGEFYQPADVAKAEDLLTEAETRLAQLAAGQAPWTTATGLVVRGFRSAIDDTPQPYGLVIPEGHDVARESPLYVWLHGRGDQTTDLHFLAERRKSKGQLLPEGAIVLHPFGRHCNGWKSAGEVDVLEAIEAVCGAYAIDRRRIVLAGFSMGGAGAWHLGAHYAERWCAVHAGAGFAETAQYNRLAPESYPPPYEQTLWRVYDVPNYVRNLFNLPVLAYSGSEDKQIQAARVMEAAYAAEGRELPHLIGPGMGHKYHPDSLAEVHRRLADAARQGQDLYPTEIHLQTRSLRYARYRWLEVLGLARHWDETRVDARVESGRTVQITTQNVTALRLGEVWAGRPFPGAGARVVIDGQELELKPVRAAGKTKGLVLLRVGEGTTAHWEQARDDRWDTLLRKRPGLQGPIDDAFLEPFLVVLPSGRCAHPAVQAYVEVEMEHFRRRWRELMRGDVRTRRDVEVTPDDLGRYHLVAWGDAAANSVIARALPQLPLGWSPERLTIGRDAWDPANHVPLMVYPNPLAPRRYVVLNSGLTFREAHDRTNSLQNPKLPDWAIVDTREPPGPERPGRIAAADFFDEHWQVRG